MKKRIYKTVQSRFFLPAIALITASLVLASCYKDKFDLNKLDTSGEWSPDVVAPLIHSELTIRDLLNDYDHNNLFVEDATQFLYLVYNNRVYSQTAADFFQMPNQFVNTDYTFTAPPVTAGNDYNTPPLNVDYTFITPGNQRVDEMDVKSGMMQLLLSCQNFPHNIDINIYSPDITKNGIPLNEYINFPGTSSDSIDLSGYKITFDNTSPNVNRVRLTYSGVLHAASSNTSSQLFTISLGESFTKLKYSKITGDFKQIAFTLPSDSVRIRLFNNNLYGSMYFENPMIHIYARNSCGMPVRINLDNFRGFSYVNAPYQEYLTGVPVPWDINAPSFSQMGQFATTELHFNKRTAMYMTCCRYRPSILSLMCREFQTPEPGQTTISCSTPAALM